METQSPIPEIVRRLWARDPTLWPGEPADIANRLGWLDSVEQMVGQVAAIRQFAEEAVRDGFATAVLLGTGGASLAAEVFYGTFGASSRALRQYVLDTTDPYSIRQIDQILNLERTLFIVASKSGTTIETRSLFAYFWERLPKGEHYVAITDPGSPLATLATERGFRKLWLNDPAIGGRYSALSYFGLVPAALIGVDLDRLLAPARAMAEACRHEHPDNPGAALGLRLAEAALAGRDKLTLLLPTTIATLGYWIEQLVAESTGKAGRGILPIEGEPPGPPEVYGADRLFVALGTQPRAEQLEAAGQPVVRLPFGDRYDIGAEQLRWMVATAVAGHRLGVNPFDEPNVAEAKEATARILASGGVPAPETDPLPSVLEHVQPGGYLAIQAYLPRTSPNHEALQRARQQLRDRYRVATTLGYGPRYLHSTGQYHKGGPSTGVFIQVVDPDSVDLPIPGQPYSFGQLKQAQALGDLERLRSRGRPVARVTLAELTEALERM